MEGAINAAFSTKLCTFKTELATLPILSRLFATISIILILFATVLILVLLTIGCQYVSLEGLIPGDVNCVQKYTRLSTLY